MRRRVVAVPRVVFITGGSSGIGRSTAEIFAGNGWHVGLIARGHAGLAATADALRAGGATVHTASADVASASELGEAAALLTARLGAPDVWVNCAGNGVYGRFADVPAHEFDRVTSVTYGGTVNGCRIALALMAPRRAGTIVNVCSASAFHGLPLMTSYAGAKAAVRCFGQALRAELRIARNPIRISSVYPPAVNTPFFSHAVSHMGWPARPAPPVYQPGVIAQAIYLAALLGTPEMLVSFTVVIFSLVNRLAPGLIAYTMTKLGFEGQLTRDAAAAALEEPTLFTPSATASPVQGPFGRGARQVSLQLLLLRLFRARLWPARRSAPR